MRFKPGDRIIVPKKHSYQWNGARDWAGQKGEVVSVDPADPRIINVAWDSKTAQAFWDQDLELDGPTEEEIAQATESIRDAIRNAHNA